MQGLSLPQLLDGHVLLTVFLHHLVGKEEGGDQCQRE